MGSTAIRIVNILLREVYFTPLSFVFPSFLRYGDSIIRVLLAPASFQLKKKIARGFFPFCSMYRTSYCSLILLVSTSSLCWSNSRRIIRRKKSYSVYCRVFPCLRSCLYNHNTLLLHSDDGIFIASNPLVFHEGFYEPSHRECMTFTHIAMYGNL